MNQSEESDFECEPDPLQLLCEASATREPETYAGTSTSSTNSITNTSGTGGIEV